MAAGSLQGSSGKPLPSPPLLFISAPTSEPGTAPALSPIHGQDRKKRHSISSSARTSAPSHASGPRSKRPPASRCSNGVETSYGPPPCSITRASWYGSSDSTHLNFPDQYNPSGPSQLDLPRSGVASYTSTRASLTTRSGGGESSAVARKSALECSRLCLLDTMSAEDLHSPRSPPDADDIYYDAEQTNGTDYADNLERNGDDVSTAHRRIKSGPGRQEDIMQSSNEDLFLNLAQDATPQQNRPRASSRSDRQQVISTVLMYPMKPAADHCCSLE